jgi:hypothetical protein
MTAHAGPIPVPARITLALDLRGLYGPQVDRDCGVEAPAVDEWEAGLRVPTRTQVEALAALTRMPVGYFYQPADEAEERGTRIFMCQRNRRPHNALTVAESRIGWDGVLQRDVLVEPRSPYQPRKTTPQPPRKAAMPARTSSTRQGRGRVHVAREDPHAPGCCATCHRPMAAPNDRHVTDPADLPTAPRGPQDLAAGDREDHRD